MTPRDVWRRLAPDAAPLLALAARLGIVMGLFTLVRFVFWIANRDLMPAADAGQVLRIFWGGLRFDLSAVLYANLLYIVVCLLPLRARHDMRWQRAVAGLFYGLNAVALGLDWADIVYYRVTMSRLTAAALQEYGNEGGGIAAMIWLWIVEAWPVAIAWIAMLFVLVWSYRRVRLSSEAPVTRARLYYPAGGLVFILAIYFSVVAMRGGFFARSHRPINNASAGAYVDDPALTAAVLNNPFSIIRTFGHHPIDKRRYFASEPELEAVYSPLQKSAAHAPKLDNVVIFILESFGREHVGGLNRDIEGYEGFTPFLDSLMEKSLVFTNAYANGAKSIDALPSVVTGIPALIESYILSPHYPVKSDSLATLLEPYGYDTSFFHGAPNGSMGFEAFVKLAGYDHYFGMTEYANPKDFDGTWGIWDEPFFVYFANELGKRPQPFLGTLFSLSSHHPYNVPPEYEGKLRVGPMHVERAIHYTDTALAHFFEVAAQQPWFEHTLFVITADHGSAPNRPAYKTSFGRFRVPLVLYAPGHPELHGVDDRPAQQLDVLPTVAHWVGVERDYVAFGRDLLDPAAQRFAVTWREGAFQVVKDGYGLRFDGDKTIGLYRYPEDILLEHNLAGSVPELQAPLEQFTRALVEQFTTRMLEDRMTAAAPLSRAPDAAVR